MATTPKPPVSEQGTTNTGGSGLASLPWSAWVDQSEYVPELVWPGSITIFERMRNDAQLAGLMDGVTLPIRKYTWLIEPNGAAPAIVDGLATDLGLDVRGQEPAPRRRRKRRFSFDDHLRQALEAIAFGHQFFEQVGDVGTDLLWHLRKLAARLPETIGEIHVDPDGGLNGIRQNVAVTNVQAPLITVDRLVAYIWDQRPGSWVGRSMFRACYREWLIKDRLIRVDANKHERNGMGVPIATAPQGAQRGEIEDLDAMTQRLRGGDSAGGAIPFGSKIELVGTTGSLPDTLASIRYLDQMMARRFLQMFGELGQTPNGSRALGEVQLDFFGLAQRQIADWFAGVFVEHVIEDWVDWNYGEQVDTVPLLVYETNDDERLSVEGLVALLGSGAITVDPDLEEAIRHQYGMPDRAQPAAAPTARRHRHRRGGTAAAETPTPAELAQTDFAALQAKYVAALADLKIAWAATHTAQIDELVMQIRAAQTPAALAAVTATVDDIDPLLPVLVDVVEHGAQSAIDEATAQGASLPAPALTDASATITAAAWATATLLSRALGDSAASKAVALSGTNLTADEIADQVAAHLTGLAGETIDYEFAGLVTKAQNTGRFTAMAGAPDTTRFYGSELNDTNTCDPCAEEDGAEFGSLAEAMADYPAGYVGCEGGNKCRGTAVAVYAEAQPSA